MKNPRPSASLRRQLQRWTLVGPFTPPGPDPWFATALDGATEVPHAFRLDGKPLKVCAVGLAGDDLDFAQAFGPSPRNAQAYAFAVLETPRACTLRLSYDADWSAVWWLDGREIFATRSGNSGVVGQMRFPLLLGLTPGRHVLAARVAAGLKGWKIILRWEGVRQGILDILRTDRAAAWRDYTRSRVRHECRPAPTGLVGRVSKEVYEQACANAGVDARWIGVVDGTGAPLFPSRALPVDARATPANERQLTEWVGVLHRHKIAALTWFPLTHCSTAAADHPEWRQRFLVPPAAPDANCEAACCVHTGYGDAVIAFCVEVLERFDLDGIWFDGAAFSPVWTSPQPVSCVCDACGTAFRRATGLALPDRYDWSRPELRRWVQWRFDAYARYWQRLVDGIHRCVPRATVVFNHYHRENIGWNSAIPLKRFGRGYVTGIEADDEPLRGALYTRLARAFGRRHTEVWMSLNMGKEDNPRGAHHNPRKLLDFGLACATAGGHASFGGGQAEVHMSSIQRLADELLPRGDALDLPAVPYLALHVSQQTETFVFGRNPAFTASQQWRDFYWNSIAGWHHALAFGGRPCDILFDDGLTAAALKPYPLLVLPLPVALTPAQYGRLLDYVQAGGTLIAGPWFGLCDRWGEPHREPVGDRKLFPFGQSLPTWAEWEHRPRRTFIVPGDGPGTTARFDADPLTAPELPDGAVCLDWTRNRALRRCTRVGAGRILQLSVDPGTLYRYSESPLAVRALDTLFAGLPRPLLETVAGPPLLSGLFRRGRGYVAHLQQFAPPWEPTRNRSAPPARWHAVLRWNGPRPHALRCILPEPGPDLPLERDGRGWRFVLPPLGRGQVLRIET